jgi:hypothetical protein
MAAKADESGFVATVHYGKQEEKRYRVAKALKSSAQRSVIVFGMTGHGKSSFLNFILRQNFFKTSLGQFGDMNSVTKGTHSAYAIIERQQMMLIDTPGFMDTHDIQFEGSDKPSADEIVKAEVQAFRRNILQAYLDAGEEVGAFIFVYSLTARWTMEVTQMTKFLQSLSFPWEHCIVVLTHGDHPFPGMSEEERYTALQEAMAQNKLPKALKEVIENSNYRTLIVENTRGIDDHGYHCSVIKKFIHQIENIPGPFHNPHFLHFSKLLNRSRQEAYKAVLHDENSLSVLEAETKDLLAMFKLAAKEVAVAQVVFIENLKKIVEIIDSKVFTKVVTAATGVGGTVAIAAGVAAVLLGVGLIPVTFGASTAAIIGGVVAVAGGGLGVTLASPGIKWLMKRSEVQNAQTSYDNAIVKIRALYQLYEEIMQKIQEDILGCDHPEVHDLLFAHLAGVHMHSAKTKGDELCETAENLAVFYRLRKQAKEQSKEESDSNLDSLKNNPNYAIPVGFNLLARGYDVAHTVGATVEVTQVSTESKVDNSQMLRDTCISTLQDEMEAITTLSNLPK